MLCPYSRSVSCGVTLSILAVQPVQGNCSASQGVSYMAYHRSHHQQRFYLFSVESPPSFQSHKKSNQFLLKRVYKPTLSRKVLISPAQLMSQEQDQQVHGTVPEMFFKLQTPPAFPWIDLILLDHFSPGI